MSSIINKPCILKLNANWMPIGFATPRKTFIDMVTGVTIALDLVFSKGLDGEYNFDEPQYTNPVTWDEWITLPIRDFDQYINTARSQVRVPKVVIAKNCSIMPFVRPEFSKRAVFERDGFTCLYTGTKIDPKDADEMLNIDHVVPRSKGGQSRWNNVVTSLRSVNSAKANKSVKEAGLKLKSAPKEPNRRPIAAKLFKADRDAIDPQWRWLVPKLS